MAQAPPRPAKADDVSHKPQIRVPGDEVGATRRRACAPDSRGARFTVRRASARACSAPRFMLSPCRGFMSSRKLCNPRASLGSSTRLLAPPGRLLAGRVHRPSDNPRPWGNLGGCDRRQPMADWARLGALRYDWSQPGIMKGRSSNRISSSREAPGRSRPLRTRWGKPRRDHRDRHLRDGDDSSGRSSPSGWRNAMSPPTSVVSREGRGDWRALLTSRSPSPGSPRRPTTRNPRLASCQARNNGFGSRVSEKPHHHEVRGGTARGG